jgi:class 3 adenylate cyclase
MAWQVEEIEMVTEPIKAREIRPANPVPAPGKREMRGERRIITALFCDVVNSTGLAENLDPEDWVELMNRAFQRLNAPIVRYEGTVAKLMGDAVLAFFGAPIAHEDDPQRAVLAALDMLASVRFFAEEVRREMGIDFNIRIGINTGPVVVGDVGSAQAMEYTAMGDAVNIAARMEQTAAPGTVQVSQDTFRLIEPYFEVEALGGVELKGKSEPVSAYRVIRTKGVPGDSHRGIGAPLIGRDQQLARMSAVLADLKQGKGRIVAVIGEAGLGKSRLIAELFKEWERDGLAGGWDVAHGIPYDANRPFGLFQNFARQMFGIELDDPPEIIHHKIDNGLRSTGASDDVVSLCSVAVERVIAAKVLHDAAQDYPAEVIRQDLYDNVYPAWIAAAKAGPRVMVLDDLQWADPASIDLLIHLFKMVEEVPILFLCAFRPERQAPSWRIKQVAESEYPHRYDEFVLQPLDAEDTDSLVSALLNITDLPEDLHELILRKTDGNPYFVEEVVRTLIDQGTVLQNEAGLQWKADTKVADIPIPDNLQALLMARIDRLDEQTKLTLQAASVIGRAFYFRILERISDTALSLDKQMLSLERAELLREAGRVPELEYMFKHDLARDAAYGSMLNRKRREFHKRVAEAMESIFGDQLEEHAHRLAQHFALAGNHERAVRYFIMAGEVAEGLHATAESAVHFGHALDAARQLGDLAVIARLEAKGPSAGGLA